MSAEDLRAKIREIPDFPKPGILFYDITTLLKDPAAFKEAIDLMLEPYRDEKIDQVEWGNYIRKSQDSLRVIAEETGGYAVINQNDFDKALKRIDAETSDYYVLGFYSSNPDPLRRTRRIEVVTKRDGVKVWSRTSYSLRPTPADTATATPPSKPANKK